MMKAEPSRLIPRKLTANLSTFELLLFQQSHFEQYFDSSFTISAVNYVNTV